MDPERTGPLGALLDEYERAAREFVDLIATVPSVLYGKVVDPDSPDPDCRSIQTIVRHVIAAGCGYDRFYRRCFGDPELEILRDLPEQNQVPRLMEEVLARTADTVTPRFHLTEKELSRHRADSSWGTSYDVEQMFEHGIVHILRHRRQIERLLRQHG